MELLAGIIALILITNAINFAATRTYYIREIAAWKRTAEHLATDKSIATENEIIANRIAADRIARSFKEEG